MLSTSTFLLRRRAHLTGIAHTKRALSSAAASADASSPVSPAADSAATRKPLSELLQDLKASEHFDLIVIGSGPAGQKCAIDHAKHGKSVAIIDKRDMVGGVCIHTGTVPSKVRSYPSLLEVWMPSCGRALIVFLFRGIHRPSAKPSCT
jgi:heterodisulfide reductase subunit A-like polyferredoxin